MSSLADPQAAGRIKLLAYGDSKTRKTTSLVSLVAAGFKLRILNLDNLLGPLRNAILKTCPDKLGNVEQRPLRDEITTGASGTLIKGKPRAWLDALGMCNRWKYDDTDLGEPSTWGEDCILVVDSLSRACDAAYALHESMIPKRGGKGGEYDGRAAFYSAQEDVENWLGDLTSDNFHCNVIVIGHGVYMKLDDGSTRIMPQGIGNKLSPKIPQYFPNVVYYKRNAEDYVIQLESDRMVNLANDGAGRYIGPVLPIATGLATIFKTIQAMENPPTQQVKPSLTKPAIINLRK